MRIAPKIVLTSQEQRKLESLRASRKTAQRLRERSAMVLLAAAGLENKAIAQRLNQDPGKVGRWRSRYSKLGFAGIEQDATRPGRIKPLSRQKQSEVGNGGMGVGCNCLTKSNQTLFSLNLSASCSLTPFPPRFRGVGGVTGAILSPPPDSIFHASGAAMIA